MINNMTNAKTRHTTMLKYYLVDALMNLSISTLFVFKFMGSSMGLYLNSFTVTFSVFTALYLLGVLSTLVFITALVAKWSKEQGKYTKSKIVFQFVFFIFWSCITDIFHYIFMVTGGAGLWPHDDIRMRDLEQVLVLNLLSAIPKQIFTFPLIIIICMF